VISPVPASVLTIADDEITLDAELLAPMIGLPANTDYPSLLNLGRIAL
jgi:hypothetical protein